MALSYATRESIWHKNLIGEILEEPDQCIKKFADNHGSMALVKNPIYHKQRKHIDIQHHFIREKIENKHINLSYCPTEEMVADMLTKEIGRVKNEKCCATIGLAPPDTVS